MFYDYVESLHREQSHDNLKQLFGKNVPSRTHVYFWFGEFRRGRRSFNDAHRCGIPATAVTITNIEGMKKILRAEPRITTREIHESLCIGTAVAMSTLHDHLRVRKRCARWIRHLLKDEQRRGRGECCELMLRKFNGGGSELTWEVLTGDETWIYRYDPETKMQSAVSLFPDESPPQKLKISRSAQKKMVACFFGKSGHVATIPLEDRREVTANWYVHHCLPKVFKVWCQRRSKTGLRGLFLHHGDASARAQQQQRLPFSMRARCSCCRTHRIRRTSLPETVSYSQK